MRLFLPCIVAPFLLASAHAQVVAAAGAGAAAAAPHLVAALPAILTSAVSSGSAHVGQAVVAKLANPAVLSDGSKLPAGTQLLGHITQAVPVSKGSGKSSLGMVFDHFKGTGNQTLPFDPAELESIGSGRKQSQSQQNDQASAGASADANTNAGGGAGGLLGGVTNAVGGTVNGVVNTTSGLLGTVTGLPGVLLQSTGTLVAQGQNVNVPAGTRVSIAASASAGSQ